MHWKEKADFPSPYQLLLVVPKHAPNCEEGWSVETWIASRAFLAHFPIQKMYCAVIARSYHSFCSVFRFLFGNRAPGCVISLLNNCLWQSPVMLQSKSAALCQESSLKMTILQANRLLKIGGMKSSPPLTEPWLLKKCVERKEIFFSFWSIYRF